MRAIGHGGLLSVFHSPDKGFWACLGDLPPDGLRLGFRCAIYCCNSVAFRAHPLSSGRIVCRATMGRVTPFIPVRDLMSSTCYCQLFKATTACTSASTDARAALSPHSCEGTRVRLWQSALKLLPDMRRLQLPLDDCCRLVLPYHAEISVAQN